MPVINDQYEWEAPAGCGNGGELGCEPLEDGSGMIFTIGVDVPATNSQGEDDTYRAWEDFKMDWEEARALRDYLNKVVK